MAYNPDMVNKILGESVAELFDGTIAYSTNSIFTNIGNLKSGDTVTFALKDKAPVENRQFVISLNYIQKFKVSP